MLIHSLSYYTDLMYSDAVDVKCPRCGCDDRLTRVQFTRTRMRGICRCGHVFSVALSPAESLDVQCAILWRNPFAVVGPMER